MEGLGKRPARGMGMEGRSDGYFDSHVNRSFSRTKRRSIINLIRLFFRRFSGATRRKLRHAIFMIIIIIIRTYVQCVCVYARGLHRDCTGSDSPGLSKAEQIWHLYTHTRRVCRPAHVYAAARTCRRFRPVARWSIPLSSLAIWLGAVRCVLFYFFIFVDSTYSREQITYR